MAKSVVAVAFEGKVEGLQRSIGEVSGTLEKLVKGATSGYGLMATAGIGAAAGLFKIGESFQEQFNKISTGTGATGQALKGLESDFKKTLSGVPDSFDKVGTAITVVNQKLGLSGKPLQEVSKQLLDLSRITKTDLTANIQSATGVFNQFKVSADKQKDTLDELYRASQASGVGFGDLTAQVSGSANVFQALGFSVEQATTVVAGLGKEGLSTADVMPALSKVLGVAAKSGKDAQVVYQDLIRSIKQAPSGTAAAKIAFDELGAKAGPKFAALVRSGKYSFDQLGESIAEGSDTIDKGAKRAETFGEKWSIIKNRVLVGLEPVATGVFNAMGKAMDHLGPALDAVAPKLQAIGDFVKDHKVPFEILAGIIGTALVGAVIAWGVQSAIAAGIAVAGFVATEAKAIASAATQVVQFGLVIAGYVATGIAATASGLAMAAAWIIGLGPIALVIAAVAGAAALIVTHWDQIVGAAKAVWHWIADNWPLILAILTGPIGLAVRFIIQHWDSIKDGFTKVKNWIGDRLGDIVGFFTGMPGRIAKAASGMWDGIKTAFRAVINWIIRGWNSLHFHIPGVHVGPIGFDGFDLGVPQIPQLAAGGIVQSRLGGILAQLGEGGVNEAVIPLSRGGVRPLVDALVERLRSEHTTAPVVENHWHIDLSSLIATEHQNLVNLLRRELEQITRRNGFAGIGL